MRPTWAALLLALCLVFSQQGALLHELGHLARPGAAPQQAGRDGGAARATDAPGVDCDVCLAFDHLVGAVPASIVLPALLSTEDHWRLTARFALRAADAPRARARDPPADT